MNGSWSKFSYTVKREKEDMANIILNLFVYTIIHVITLIVHC